jgi:hypothetical protein
MPPGRASGTLDAGKIARRATGRIVVWCDRAMLCARSGDVEPERPASMRS